MNTTLSPERCFVAAGSAWRDPESDPPTLTGKILVWLPLDGPAIVVVDENSMSFWDGNDTTELTEPHEWDAWAEITPPNNPNHQRADER